MNILRTMCEALSLCEYRTLRALLRDELSGGFCIAQQVRERVGRPWDSHQHTTQLWAMGGEEREGKGEGER